MVSNNSVVRDSTVLRITTVGKFGALHRAERTGYELNWQSLHERMDLIGQKGRPILYFFSTIFERIGREPYLSKK